MSTAHLEKLTFDKVGRLAGGQVAEAVDAAIAGVLTDLRRRPHDRRARKVVLTLTIRPGLAHKSEVRAEAKAVIPGDAVCPVLIDLDRQNPELLFNPVSATHLDQQPIPFDPPAAEAAAKPARKPRRKGA